MPEPYKTKTTTMNIKKKSKFLSLVLRHKPEKIGITLDSAGWVSVSKLLQALERHGSKMTMDELEYVVEHNDKKRFSFNDDKTQIRANQGHSVDVDLEYEEQEPPDVLYHGTAERYLRSIFNTGLSKMGRHHVHLSKDRLTAAKVGQRKGKYRVLKIYAKKMYEDGFKFYLSINGVWLVDRVPKQYIK